MDKEATNKEKEKESENGESKNWYAELASIFTDVMDLREGLDRYGTILSIRKKVHLKGVNVWMLICAIVVASIGLDKSSPAVIIGGMLISPLMYPILGLGLSIAINDRDTLVKSAENFGVAVIITLITSTIYFMLTPYGKPNVEILSRTAPDIMDVFVGFFGGIAGIVAGSRKDGTSAAIPGVAIATALLPPLCVAGFGLANFNLSIFAGAFYLFILNTFFIMIATYLVVRYLKFPLKKHTTQSQGRKARIAITLASILIIIPSFFFLRNSVNDIRRMNRIEAFVAEHLETETINDFGWDLKEQDSVSILEVDCYVEDLLDVRAVDSMETILTDDYRCKGVSLKLNQIEAKGDEIREMQANQSELRTEIEQTRQAYTLLVNEKDGQIEELNAELTVYESDSVIFHSLRDELKIFYPDLTEISAGRLWYSDYKGKSEQFTLILDWERTYYESVYKKRSAQITEFAMKRYPGLDTVYVIHQ
ncbi:MAG: DUF389 domain-containing protein [Bacteroidetes bacterium]|nr:DUF389 domain-containing protein [Bacteroidota bacterium]